MYWEWKVEDRVTSTLYKRGVSHNSEAPHYLLAMATRFRIPAMRLARDEYGASETQTHRKESRACGIIGGTLYMPFRGNECGEPQCLDKILCPRWIIAEREIGVGCPQIPIHVEMLPSIPH